MANYNTIPTRLIRNDWKNMSNIKASKFLSTWPNGRPYKHGAMEISFGYNPTSRTSAEGEIELFMRGHGYVRSEHYHIPLWNFNTRGYNHGYPDYVNDRLIITFATDEQFVMAKMSWGLDDEHT